MTIDFNQDVSIGPSITPGYRLLVEDDVRDVVRIESTESSASSGPNLELYRNRTAVNNDFIGKLRFIGNNSTPAEKTYAFIQAQILDVTPASEDALLAFNTLLSGASATRFLIGQGCGP